MTYDVKRPISLYSSVSFSLVYLTWEGGRGGGGGGGGGRCVQEWQFETREALQHKCISLLRTL